MVDLLSRATPDDWQTYVKEHPKQFYFDKLGERSRHAYDYRDLDDIEGVSLVDLSCGSSDLISNSRAVATVTGTAGWEAVVRGTPSIVFGNAWYQACPSVFRTETKSEIADAIDAIRSGVTIDRRGVLSFVRSVEDVGFRIPGGEARLDPGMDSDSETIRTLSDALVEFVDLKR